MNADYTQQRGVCRAEGRLQQPGAGREGLRGPFALRPDPESVSLSAKR